MFKALKKDWFFYSVSVFVLSLEFFFAWNGNKGALIALFVLALLYLWLGLTYKATINTYEEICKIYERIFHLRKENPWKI